MEKLRGYPMTNVQTSAQVQQSSVHDEMILVVKREHLFAQEPAWNGLKEVQFDAYLKLIQEKKQFLPRAHMEIDFDYKQIIPYLIFTYDNKYFLMQRSSSAGEKRLQNKYTLGIGGIFVKRHDA